MLHWPSWLVVRCFAFFIFWFVFDCPVFFFVFVIGAVGRLQQVFLRYSSVCVHPPAPGLAVVLGS